MRTTGIKTLLSTAILWLLLTGFRFEAHTQQHRSAKPALLPAYRQADAIYYKAVHVNPKNKASEAQEEKLNGLALQKFRLLAAEVRLTDQDSLGFFIHLKLGELEHYFYNLPEAINQYREAIALKARVAALPDSLLFKPYLYSGILYYSQSKFDSALLYYEKAEKIQAQYTSGLQDNERLYNNLGGLYYETGNYKQAKNYFQKAAEVLPRANPSYKELLVYYNINIATSFMMLNEYDQAYQTCLHVLPYGVNTSEINHTIGLVYLNRGDAATALRYFQKVSYASDRVIRLYNDMGNAYLKINQPDSARRYLQKALASNEAFHAGNANVAHGLTLKYLGDAILAASKTTEALGYYQQAIRQFYPDFKDENPASSPQRFSGVFSYINLFNALIAKAEAWHIQYGQLKNMDAAKEALKTYQSAFTLIDYVERTYDNDEARLFLNKIKYTVHGKPIDIAFALYKKTGDRNFLETAYRFDQKNKATVLTINQQQNQTMSASSGLVQKERELKTAITRLALKAAQLTDSKAIEKSSVAIRDYEIALGKVQNQLSKTHPVTDTIPSLSTLQKDFLDAHTAILSYHLSPGNLTIFVIEQQAVEGFQVPLYAAFTTEVARFVQGLQNNNAQLFQNPILPKKLFRFLIGSRVRAHISRLIIIPDDELNYLPFEALQDDETNFLIKKYSVQYQYSTALLKKEDGGIKRRNIVAFAPFASAGAGVQQGFSTIPFSLEEVTGIKGLVFTNAQATKAAFLQNSLNHDVVHLATHAVVNDSVSNRSYIVFSPNSATKDEYLLYVDEVYNLPLRNVHLVILSACETGSGGLVKGEGIMSLSRAFAYAGCANSITSLWKANDESTAFLTKRIHRYLAQGQPVAEAVQQAKLDLLASTEINPRLKAPAYWANLIFTGNYTPLKTKPAIWPVFAALLCAALLLLIIRRKRT